MNLRLEEAEIRRAVQHYLASKMPGTEMRDLDVSLHWRGKQPYALVEVLRPAPTLTDEVSE